MFSKTMTKDEFIDAKNWEYVDSPNILPAFWEMDDELMEIFDNKLKQYPVENKNEFNLVYLKLAWNRACSECGIDENI